MPIYEFECPNCKEQIEEITGQKEEVRIKCPKCGHKLTWENKILSGHAFTPGLWKVD